MCVDRRNYKCYKLTMPPVDIESITSITDVVRGMQGELARRTAEYADKYRPDVEFLKGISGEKPPDLISEVRTGMEKSENMAGSAYIGLLGDACMFDRQVERLRAGVLPAPEVLQQEGYELLIDPERTTTELLAQGLVIPTLDARTEMVGFANGLDASLGAYISRISREKSNRFAELVCQPKTFTSWVKRLVPSRGPTIEEQAGLSLGPEEVTRINEILSRKFLTIDEARETVSREMQTLSKNNPRIVGLENPVRLRQIIKDFTNDLDGEHFINNDPIPASAIDGLTFLMRGDVMDQLGVYPGYAEAVVESVKAHMPIPDDVESGYSIQQLIGVSTGDQEGPRFAGGNSGEGANSRLPSDAVEGEVVYANGEWLVDDIDEGTKAWLEREGEVGATERYTPEEERTAQDFAEEMYSEAARRDDANAGGATGCVGALNEISSNNNDQETMQLLLRIAIKIGTKVAVVSAKEIAKDPNTPREMRIALGIFCDLADEGGKFAEKLITGEDKPDLGRDCVNYVRAKFVASPTPIEA